MKKQNWSLGLVVRQNLRDSYRWDDGGQLQASLANVVQFIRVAQL